MNLWQAILTNVTKKCEGEMIMESDIEQLFEKECYMVLERIKTILRTIIWMIKIALRKSKELYACLKKP